MHNFRNENLHKTYFLFPICLGLGTGVGALIGNVGLGLAAGAGIGTLLSLLGWWWEQKG